jgi:hypothetical protein
MDYLQANDIMLLHPSKGQCWDGLPVAVALLGGGQRGRVLRLPGAKYR